MREHATKRGLVRRLNRLHGAMIMAGMMIGAGIFVVTGEAAAELGPLVPLGFLVVIPLIMLTALIYSIYMSGPLAQHAGGAYVHISRTWNSLFLGYIVMWTKWIAYAGTIASVGIGLGEVLHAYKPLAFLSDQSWALISITIVFVINLLGVAIYARFQTVATITLIAILLLLLVPGLFFIDAGNFSPVLPAELYADGVYHPLLSGISILLFSYIGFEALAQAGEETNAPDETLPRLFVVASAMVGVLYTLVTFVVIGVIGWQLAADTHRPLVVAAQAYFPGGTSVLVAFATILAFVTTMNTSYMVPSRLLYAFGKDQVVPPMLAHVNRRFRTPDISLLITFAVSVILMVTATFTLAIKISVAAVTLVYFIHSLSGMLLPWLRPELYRRSRFRPAPVICFLIGASGAVMMALLGWQTLEIDGLAPALDKIAAGHVLTGITRNPAIMLAVWALLGATVFVGYRLYLVVRGRRPEAASIID